MTDNTDWRALVEAFEAKPGQSLTAFAVANNVPPKLFRDHLKRSRLGEPMPKTQTKLKMDLDDVLVQAASEHHGLSITQVANAAGVSRTLARKWLNWLVEEQRLVKIGRSASQRFVVPE